MNHPQSFTDAILMFQTDSRVSEKRRKFSEQYFSTIDMRLFTGISALYNVLHYLFMHFIRGI